MLVSSNCDAPANSRLIDPHEVEQLCMDETGIESIQTSIDAPDTHKRCISVVLRNYIRNEIGQSAKPTRASVRRTALVETPKLHA